VTNGSTPLEWRGRHWKALEGPGRPWKGLRHRAYRSLRPINTAYLPTVDSVVENIVVENIDSQLQQVTEPGDAPTLRTQHLFP
jgi:hypothetical protein